MKYSVIVPVYNTHNELQNILAWFERVSSSRKQKDVELIIIDDGSSIALDSDFPDNVRYFYKNNGGVSSARNVGIKKAEGEFILFLDSDDDYRDDILSILDQKTSNLKPDLIVFSFMKVFANNQKIAKNKAGSYEKNKFIQQCFTKKIKLHICACAFRKQLLLENKLTFNEGISHSEDILFIVNAIFSSKLAIAIDDVLYYYNCREGSAVNSPFSLKALSHFSALKLIADKNDSSNTLYLDFFLVTCYMNLLAFLIKNKTHDESVIKEFVYHKRLLDKKVFFDFSSVSILVNLFRLLRFCDNNFYGFLLKRLALR